MRRAKVDLIFLLLGDMCGRLPLEGHMQVHESQIRNSLKQIVGKILMLNNYPTATKCVSLVSNLWLLSVFLIMVHFYLLLF